MKIKDQIVERLRRAGYDFFTACEIVTKYERDGELVAGRTFACGKGDNMVVFEIVQKTT